MTINQLASKIAKLEGRKSQARIGDLREILGILSDLVWEQYLTWDPKSSGQEIFEIIFKNGEKRAKKRKKNDR